jgi:hypothetical protein
MSISLTFPFTSSTDYTFDSALVEVSGTNAQLKSLIPTNGTLGSMFSTSIDATWGNGVLTGTANAGAVISGGKLDCTGGLDKWVSYAALANASTATQTGCIRFKYTPNYSGIPSSIRELISIHKTANAKNLISLKHLSGSGNLQFWVYSNTLSQIINFVPISWLPVSGTEYEFEINWDLTAGATRIFLNGSQIGATQIQTGTRDTDIDYIKVGGYYTSSTSDGYFKDVIIYSTVQHTSNYTSGYSAEKYSTTNPTIEGNSSWVNEGLDGFTETATKTGTDQVKYILKKGTSWYWWNGTSWVVSAGTYAQSNTATEIETNKASFVIEPESSKFKAFLHSDGTTTPQLDTLVIQYNYAGEGTDSIHKTIVWGYREAGDTTPIVFTPSSDNVLYKLHTRLSKKNMTYVVSSFRTNGYWEVEIIDTENMEGTQYYNVDLGNGIKKSIQVASVATLALEDVL